MELLPQLIVSGLSAGVLYAITALGLVLIYKTSDVVNFAHGDMATIATFVAFTVAVRWRQPLIVAALGAVLFAALLGVVVQFGLLRRIEHAPTISKIILTLGIGQIIFAVEGSIWGYDTYSFPQAWQGAPFEVAGLVVGRSDILIFAIAVVVMGVLAWFFRGTLAGVAMRATAENMHAATLMGVNITRVLALTWAVGVGLSAVAGILIAPQNFLDQNFMFEILIKGFAAAVLGGFTSLPGVVLGGLLLGVLENLVGLYIATEWKTAFAFGLIVVMLAIRPQGLLGAELVKKV
ncbi:MAG TPA: branched-chain amino acid ABC transporter permease [Dehalococcoidia bacterium]|nr:branched-chain amino acid ABC transporter permease [Dehalococcoidia bacterium]